MQIGDLLGGKDPERNEILEQLRRTFHAPPVGSDGEMGAEGPAKQDAQKLGL